MKRLFLLIVFFCCISFVSAFELTYSEWSEVYPKGLDEILIQSEDRYLWYKDNIYDVEYLIKEKIKDKLYDENDIEYYESEELDYMPEEYSERHINRTVKQIIYTKSDIAGISLINEDGNITISEVTLLKNDKELIPFHTEFDFLNNGVLNDYHPVGDGLYLYFDNKLDLDELDHIYISVYYNKKIDGQENISFNFISDVNHIIYYVDYGVFLCQTQNCTLNPNKNMFRDSLYHDRVVYTYTDKLYKTYRLNREYTSEYLANKEGYEKDINSKKTYYRYITNDYILVDSIGNIVTDDHYCNKSFCKLIFLEKPNNPEPTPEPEPGPEPEPEPEPTPEPEPEPEPTPEPEPEPEKPVPDNPQSEELINELISNPQTYDGIYDFIVLFIASGITLMYFIVEKRHMIKKSKNVESI